MRNTFWITNCSYYNDDLNTTRVWLVYDYNRLTHFIWYNASVSEKIGAKFLSVILFSVNWNKKFQNMEYYYEKKKEEKKKIFKCLTYYDIFLHVEAKSISLILYLLWREQCSENQAHELFDFCKATLFPVALVLYIFIHILCLPMRIFLTFSTKYNDFFFQNNKRML